MARGPFSEEKRHSFTRTSANEVNIVSYTSRLEAFQENPNQSAVIELLGEPSTKVRVLMTKPVRLETETTLGELFAAAAIHLTGPFPKESFMLHRLTPQASSRVTGELDLGRDQVAGPGYLYLRVKQRNGQMAWTSPWFIH